VYVTSVTRQVVLSAMSRRDGVVVTVMMSPGSSVVVVWCVLGSSLDELLAGIVCKSW